MASDQERYNKAYQNTAETLKGTYRPRNQQSVAAKQAAVNRERQEVKAWGTTGDVLNGTYNTKNQRNLDAKKRSDAARKTAEKRSQDKPDFSNQKGVDRAYKTAVGNKIADGKYKNTLQSDRKIAAGMMEKGADPKMMRNSLRDHSPAVAKGVRPDKRDLAAQGIVAKAQNDIKNNQPRDERENQSPSHQTRRGDTPKPSQAQMMAAYHHHNRSR